MSSDAASPVNRSIDEETYGGEHAKLYLPSRWNPSDTHPNLKLSEDGLQVTNVGPPCTTSCESAACRADKPVPSRSAYLAAGGDGVYYYEVEVIELGEKGSISMGFGSPEMRLSRMVGWDRNSWAYHADDGGSNFGRNDYSAPYGTPCATGDVVGCGVDYTRNAIFYTKNGVFLGLVYHGFSLPSEITLYPAVGTRRPTESVRANFGDKPFVYDLKSFARAHKGRVPGGW